MNKKVILSAMFLSLGTLLSGCGRQITTTKQTYHADGMVAVIKGNTNAKKQHTKLIIKKPNKLLLMMELS